MRHGAEEADAFASQTRFACEQLARIGRQRIVPALEPLCQEGQATGHCYVVTAGNIEVVKTLAGTPRTLARHGPGSIVALMAALDGGPCRVGVNALAAVTVAEISRDALFALLGHGDDACPILAAWLATVSIRRLRLAVDELAQAIHRSLLAADRPGRIDTLDLAGIHARNHVFCVEGWGASKI